MPKISWKIGPLSLRWFLKMLILPGLVTYLLIAGCGHLVYLHRCSEARALTDRINAAANGLRNNPRWAYKLIDPQDLMMAGVVSEADGNRTIPGHLTFARFLAPGGRPFVVWTCDDAFGHQEYPPVAGRAGVPLGDFSR